MESFESKHSDQGFAGQLAKALGVTAPPLRLDSQAKYGNLLDCDYSQSILVLCSCCLTVFAL